ncbi:hypothetical protein J6590_024905 [Homalodisca vitripennis]|nr:hypothetical protein J6590_024905 [Homalodisca vitripennis]
MSKTDFLSASSSKSAGHLGQIGTLATSSVPGFFVLYQLAKVEAQTSLAPLISAPHVVILVTWALDRPW